MMFRRMMIILLVFIPLWLSAQEMPFALKSHSRYSASSMFGKVAVDSTDYYRAVLIQEFRYRKFGTGIYLDFLFDKDYHLRKQDWDNIGDIIGKVYYVSYAEMNDPFYAHLGGFPDHTIGNGLVMNNYSNMQYYPAERNLGVMFGGSPHWPLRPSFQLFSSNVEKNQIISFAARVQPMPDSTLKYVDIFDIGVGIYADRDQKGGLKKHTDPEIYQELDMSKKAPLAIYSLDYRLQIFNTPKAVFGTYAEIAHITGSGTGAILPGLYGDFKFLVVNLEYRVNGKQFYPGFFDNRYEEERAVAIAEVDTVTGTTNYKYTTKEQSIQAMDASYGIMCKLKWVIGKKVQTRFAWQNLYGENLEKGKSLWFNVNVDTQYKRLENVRFAYSKTNVDKLALGKIAVPNASMSASIMFSLNEKRKVFFIGQYSEKYKDKEGDIKWWKDTKRSVAVGVKVDFK